MNKTNRPTWALSWIITTIAIAVGALVWIVTNGAGAIGQSIIIIGLIFGVIGLVQFLASRRA